MAENEAKILKEADMQEKILQAVEKIRLQIKQLKQAQEGTQAEVKFVKPHNYANFNPLMQTLLKSSKHSILLYTVIVVKSFEWQVLTIK